LVALARGEYLPTGPDGSVLPEDRRAFSGDSLGFFAACLFIKGDWMEFAATLGFPTWSSVSHPCMLCDCSLETAYRLIGASPLGSPWNPRDLAWYFGACARCEIPVVLSDDDYRTVRATLHYDKRKQGSLGRALALELPALGLRAGDRLEPSASVPDIGEGFDASNPGSAIFWRIPDSVETHHRNPIFNEETGLGPEALLVDALHSGSSGVFKYFGQELNWALFKKNVWQVQDGTADGRLISNTNRLRGDLFDWYKMESALGRNHCRVQALTYHMLGSEAEPDLKLHAAETNGYLKFCGWLLDRYGDVLDHAELWRTAQSGLAKMQDMISENPEVFGDADCQVAWGRPPPPEHINYIIYKVFKRSIRISNINFVQKAQVFVDLCVDALGAMAELGLSPRPKFHAWVHLATDVYEKGSPAVHACWVDEGLNKILKATGSGAHCSGWYERTLSNANRVLDRLAKRRRK